MSWLYPSAHIAWMLVAAVALLMWLAARRRRSLAAEMGDQHSVERLGPGSQSAARVLTSILLLAGLAFLVLALAGPRSGAEPREVELSGLDLVVALDVSRSMLAEDVAPSRLARAREEISRLATRLSDDRIALITFAGDAYLQMPLSTDRAALRLYLETASPDLIPAQGTSFSNMLAVANTTFENAGTDGDRTRVLLIISDGEDHEGGLDAQLRQLRESAVHTLALGIGTAEGGPIPIGRDGDIIFHRERAGQIVHTQLQPALLRRIAGDDAYFEITRTSSSAERLGTALDRLERQAFGTIVYHDHVERYQWPLAAALLLLIAEIALRDRRRASAVSEVAA